MGLGRRMISLRLPHKWIGWLRRESNECGVSQADLVSDALERVHGPVDGVVGLGEFCEDDKEDM